MTPQEFGYELYATMTLIYGTADRLEFFAGRDHPLFHFLHHHTDPAIGAEYWLLYGPPETAETVGIGQPIEAHLAAAKQFLSALEAALLNARDQSGR